ncbi:hypothetical protein LCGC14_2807060, partial [marine sediment metagenome]
PKALKAALAAFEAKAVAGGTLEQLPSGPASPARTKAQNALDDAIIAYEQAVDEAFATNVDVDRVRNVLALYVSSKEASKMPRKRLKARQKERAKQMDALHARHADQLEQIDQANAAYRAWAEKRTGLDDPADLKRLVAQAGVLEFRIAATLPGGQRGTELTNEQVQRYYDRLASEGPLAGRTRNEPNQWFPLLRAGERLSPDLVIGKYAGRKYVLLSNQSGFTMLHQNDQKRPWGLSASKGLDNMNRPAVDFELDPRGAKLMGAMTSTHKGHFMAILLDDEVYSCPVIQASIYNRGVVTGDFTDREVGELVRTLNAGALQARVNPDPVSEKVMAPTMGEDNRKAGIRAAIWGLIFVAVFMLAYYLYAGAIANVALMFNLILVLGAMSFIEAVFTLPGIAGLILTIGMA